MRFLTFTLLGGAEIIVNNSKITYLSAHGSTGKAVLRLSGETFQLSQSYEEVKKMLTE